MKTRLISAIVALPLLFFILIEGGIWLLAGAFILSIIGMFEFYKPFKSPNKPVYWIGYIMTIFWYAGLYFEFSIYYYQFVIMLGLFSVLSLMVFKNISFQSVAITLFGFFYVPFTLSHIILISHLGGSFFIWFPFIIAFLTDTFAYLVGKLIGKTPLIPSVSPNKTVEGALGGVLAGLIFSFLYAALLKPEFQVYAIFLGLVGSVLSQVGDLIASKMKRIHQIKDFGNIMPGHGGVLDRFDSLIVTMPLVFYFIVFYEFVNKIFQ